MERIVYAFNKKGDKAASMELQPLYYLETEREWITKRLARSPEMDGIAFIIDWEKKELTMVKYAEDN